LDKYVALGIYYAYIGTKKSLAKTVRYLIKDYKTRMCRNLLNQFFNHYIKIIRLHSLAEAFNFENYRANVLPYLLFGFNF